MFGQAAKGHTGVGDPLGFVARGRRILGGSPLGHHQRFPACRSPLVEAGGRGAQTPPARDARFTASEVVSVGADPAHVGIARVPRRDIPGERYRREDDADRHIRRPGLPEDRHIVLVGRDELGGRSKAGRDLGLVLKSQEHRRAVGVQSRRLLPDLRVLTTVRDGSPRNDRSRTQDGLDRQNCRSSVVAVVHHHRCRLGVVPVAVDTPGPHGHADAGLECLHRGLVARPRDGGSEDQPRAGQDLRSSRIPDLRSGRAIGGHRAGRR